MDPNALDFGTITISESRHNLYKTKGEASQKKRRDGFLQKLKDQRRDLTQYARALALDMPMPEQQPVREEELQDMDSEPTTPETTPEKELKEPKEPSKKKSGKEKYRNQLLLPEPLMEIPSDLEVGWFAVPCPSGTRCLVISSRGNTISRLKSGAVLNRFPSALPSGAPGSRGKVNDYCILDCIFHEPSSTYFVVDIMCWKSYSLYDCTTDFRFYWKITKLEETTASVEAPNNPYKFVSLPFYACDRDGLRGALADSADAQVSKDDVIFYFKETDYTLGYSPLVCVLRLKTEEGAKMAQALLNGEMDAMQ